MAALIITGDEGVETRVLGQSLIEFQMRRARGAGARHIVLLVERVAPELLAAVDRLRREALTIEIARSVADAAESIHPDEVVLLLAEDVAVAPERLLCMVAGGAPTLLCVRDAPANDRYELIDPSARWTGTALLDGGLVRRTAAMVGDWDLASTLMRRAVQEGAARMTLMPDEADAELLPVEPGRAHDIGRALLAAPDPGPHGWAERWIVRPLARIAARALAEAGGDPTWLSLGGRAVLVAAALGALGGWIVLPLIAALIAETGLAAGAIAARASGDGGGARGWREWLRDGTWTVIALTIGATLTAASGQWGCHILALVTVGAIALDAAVRTNDAPPHWRADPAGLALIVLTGTLVGAPVTGLALAALHAVAAMAWRLLRVSNSAADQP